ncbi:metallophosphoesterase [Candidatus Uhrbacteria bacterium]|nr:metallophosphoesterase [Candidatus Uhrbacteria bacterium]
MSRTIAHLSDLHFDLSEARLKQAESLRDRLRERRVDHVLVTGDVTENGRALEYDQFKRVFEEFLDGGSCTVIPGNHDRLGHEVAKDMMENQRMCIVRRPGLYLIAVDTTGPHNRWSFFPHGTLARWTIKRIARAIEDAGREDFVVVAMHHHVVPLPEENWMEKLAAMFRTRFAAELTLGQYLIRRLHGRCDLLLHGHRHVPMETRLPGRRTLRVVNGGSSTQQNGFRIFRFSGRELRGEPEWVECG